MLRAAHYKADALDGPAVGKSPPKHRSGGILDLALTAADKYALSLLPTALKGTGLASNEALSGEYRGVPQHPANGIPPGFKMQRSAGLHSTPAAPQEVQLQSGVAGVATSWDASLKEILAALEPETRTLKPAKLRDHKYPNQNHGMPTNTVIPSPRRELDEALITLPGGTRRNKSSMPSYANAFKGFSRQSRRPEVQQAPAHSGAPQAMDVQYDVVPGVKLAWAGPGSGTYSTTGFGSSPKKYTSQLVGRVSPHYAGTPALQQSNSSPAGNQDPLHLPEIASGNGHGASQQQGSFRISNHTLPSFQSWNPGTATPSTASQNRRALPYVSTNTPSLAKPLTVQYHPVLKSPSLGAGPGLQYAQPPGMVSATAAGSRGTSQRPATDHGSSVPQTVGIVGPGEPTRLYPRTAYGGQPHRLPHTPPEVAAEVARLRHAQELDGVINGVRSDLMQAAAPRLDVPVKSKFLQMYEDPNRPLTRLNPKQLLGDIAPPSQHHRRHRPPIITTDNPEVSGDGRPPSSMIRNSRSPMYERRLRPLPSDVQEAFVVGESSPPAANVEIQETNALHNVHLKPPELLDDFGVTRSEHDQGIGTEAGCETESVVRSTPRSSLVDRDDNILTMADLGGPWDGSVTPGLAAAGEDAVAAGEADPSGTRAEGEAAGAAQTVLEGIEPPQAREQELEGDAAQAWSYATMESQQDNCIQPPEIPAPADEATDERLQDTEAVGVAASVAEARPEQESPTQAESTTLLKYGAGESEPTVVSAVAGDCTPDAHQAVAPECRGVAIGTAQQDTEQRPAKLGDAAGNEMGPLQVVPDQDGTSLEPDAGARAGSEVGQLDANDAEKGSPDTVMEPESLAVAEAPEAAAVPPVGVDGTLPSADGGVSSDAPGLTGAAPELEQEAAAALPDGNADLAVGRAGTEPASKVGKALEAATDASTSGECQPPDTVPTSASDATPAVDSVSYSLPPGVTPEMAKASAICIQSHARGYQAQRRMAAMRKEQAMKERAAQAQAAQGEAPPHPGMLAQKEQLAYELPQGVTPEMARAAVVRIQSHARGYFARCHVEELRRGHAAGQAALATAVTVAATRKHEDFELKAGITVEMAEAAAIRVQAHMRGHLARRHVRRMRAELLPTAEPAIEAEPASSNAAACEGEGQSQTVQAPAGEDTILREAGEAVSIGTGVEEPGPPPSPLEPEELTIDALKAALDEEQEEAEQQDAEAATEDPAPLDMSDPAAVAAAAAAAAAAKSAIRLLENGSYGLDGVADTTGAVDQAAAEASMARLAANSARTSAMFQGAGAEMRFSDDEASALELMDNLDGLLQGDDEAAAAAAAVAAATAPADGEIVSISLEGVSEPQALGAGSSGGGAVDPMDVTEPGGVRVLAGKYEVQHVVGEGAYGMVMKCKVRGTEPVQWVAIKEFKIDDNDPDAEDVKRTSLREVAVLEALQHPHVVGFVDKFMVGDRLFIVMEFLPCNLLELLEAQPGGMDRDAVRLIMFQLCSAIAFIHSKGMVYRDIKPENLLVDEHGTVKLCDFGFARYLPSGPSSHLTDYVATRWYRAPELLLGPPYRDALDKHIQYMYGPPVDMWAVGCLMGELLDGEPLFAGDSDLDQLYRVQQILGPMAPSHQYMFYANPHNTGIVFNIKQPMSLGARYRGKVSDVELSFMAGLLEMDPDKRLTGDQCLQHPYLMDLATAANALPTPSPTISNTPTATSIDGGGSGGPVSGRDVEASTALPDEGDGGEPFRTGEVAAEGYRQGSGGQGARVSESRAGLGSRELKVGSLTRAAGSLTRGGKSLSRGSISPVAMPPVSSSPVPGAGPQRGAPKLHADENGQVVIVEGVEEGEQEVARGMATVKSISGLAAAAFSEIEPLDEPQD